MGFIFEKKNVLVTGGAGFVGSHLCDELVKTCKVICLDDFSSGDERNIDHLLADDNFKFIKHDLSLPVDLEALPELQPFKIQFQGIQEVYNLACPTSPKRYLENRIPIIRANSLGVMNALEIARHYQAKFLHFSSSVVYGPRRQENEKIAETDIGAVDFLSERSAYDEGKRFAETAVKNYREALKLDAKIVRLFRIYGPRMILGEGHMIPDFIESALENKDITIHGDDDFKSSFCYISDAIDAAVKIMESDRGGPFNIGSDRDVKIRQVAEKVVSLTGSRSAIGHAEAMLFFSPLCLPDIRRARDEIGWMPLVSLDKGLEWTIEDLRASKGLLNVRSLRSGT